MPKNRTLRRAWLVALLAVAVITETSASALPAAAQGSPPEQSASRMRSEPHGWNTRPAQLAASPSQQAVTSCEQATLNPTLDDNAQYWDNFDVGTVERVTSAYYSAPAALRMVEDDDGVSSKNPPFDDAFGQFFYVPDDTQRIEIEFNAAQASALSNGDKLYFELYAYNYAALNSGASVLDGAALDSYYVVPPANSGTSWFPVGATITDTAAIAAVRGKFAVLVLGTRVDGKAPNFDIYVDDVRASTCASASNSDGGVIDGNITQGGAVPKGIASAQMLLVQRSSAGDVATIATTTPETNGSYRFTNVPALSSGDSYQVWYQNDGLDTTRLAFYASQLLPNFEGQGTLSLPPFDIGNVVFDAPKDATKINFPATFSWKARPHAQADPGDAGYRFCLYDLATYAQICSTQVLSSPSFTLDAADLLKNSNLGEFSFAYDRPYGWYVQAIGTHYDAQNFADLGYSYANEITFIEGKPAPAPVENPRLNLASGGSSVAGKKWTIMVYMAGDNDLSSPVFAGNLRDQYATLKRIAANYKDTLNLVTLADFDEDGDTQFCVLSALPDTPCDTPADPAEREKNTADPLVLTNFISTTVSTFKTDHYMLIISGHAQMVNGIAIDETSEGAPSMTPAQLRQALTNGTAPLKARGQKLDILYYYACLMGGLESAYDAAPNANYLIASSDQAWVVDIYEQLLNRVKSTPDDPATLADGIVSDYRQKVSETAPTGLFTSIAAYNLSRAATVRTALSSLGDALRADSAAADAVRGLVQVYDSSGDDDNNEPLKDAFVDLQDLARRLAALDNPDGDANRANVKDKAAALLNLLQGSATTQANTQLVMASQQVSGLACTARRNFSNASGLMVYFPSKNIYLPAELDSYRRTFNASFNNGNSWDEFIIGYVNKTPARAPGRSRRAGLPVGGGVPASCGDVWLPVVLRR